MKAANKDLAAIHSIDKKINKNLITPDKPDAALFAAGSGKNPRNEAMLRRLGKLIDTDVQGQARRLSTARDFAKPGLTTTDTTGKSVERVLKGGGGIGGSIGSTLGTWAGYKAAGGPGAVAGGVAGGITGATIGSLLTSPATLKRAIQAGDVSADVISKALGYTPAAITADVLSKAHRALNTEQGHELIQSSMKRKQ